MAAATAGAIHDTLYQFGVGERRCLGSVGTVTPREDHDQHGSRGIYQRNWPIDRERTR
jgi:hypothetical protein